MSAQYTDDTDRLGDLVRSYEEGSFLQVEIFDESGQLIYTSGRKGFPGFRAISRSSCRSPSGKTAASRTEA